MRISLALAWSLLGAVLALARPASAEGNQAFDTCIGLATPPDQRVA